MAGAEPEGPDAPQPAASRSAYVRLLAMQPRTEGGWPAYPDFWVEGPGNGPGWHERFGDSGPPGARRVAQGGGARRPRGGSRITDAFLRLRSALGPGPA
ncbi:hypothetical protein ACFOSC_08720 [Streptantibioticus rubrisoli]|uniref:Uncharacterized protein n=1 Tax=Streptantibioticus rubrisoli TaxID=1387313 RepID=A0ABT1P5Y8_9ACTN|nr:hypothetical protein [Streptantibioticus rubrisoli]MCQ4040792.1 hypothetical protein [Streptantibioticus rubrisoli]